MGSSPSAAINGDKHQAAEGSHIVWHSSGADSDDVAPVRVAVLGKRTSLSALHCMPSWLPPGEMEGQALPRLRRRLSSRCLLRELGAEQLGGRDAPTEANNEINTKVKTEANYEADYRGPETSPEGKRVSWR